jgi:PD-(D/E)XK nuclease superfamily
VQCSFGITLPGTIDSPCQQDIMNALQADPFKPDSLETVMNERLQSCSFFNSKIENSHHMFYFGLFTAVCGSKATSNREAGRGQYDIGIALEDMNRLFLFEFKHSKTENALENDAKDGLKQIHEKQYHKNQQYCQWTCYAIGVSFFNMQMSRLECDQFQVPK